MRLCEEYAARRGLTTRHARHQSKGFLFFEGGSKLLSLLWVDGGSHPGHYEFGECRLDTRCRVLKSHRVHWDEYEPWFLSWASDDKGLVFDKQAIFDLTWRYFVRRHQRELSESFRLADIHGTLAPASPDRHAARADLILAMEARCPAASDFWRSRAMDIVSLYMHWASSLAD